MSPEAAVRTGAVSAADAVQERHVLCVDDDLDFLKSLECFLPDRINAGAPQGMWYRFLFLSDPVEALRVLVGLLEEGQSVAMLISDQKMPEMKGTEFLAEAKRLSAGSVRVLLTGYAGIESAIQAINEHLLDKYLMKPIDDDEGFTVSIQHLLQRFEMELTIESQAAVLGRLYRFSNRLNASENAMETLESIASFTAEALDCQQSFVLARDAHAVVRSSSVGFPGAVEQWLALPLMAESRKAESRGPSFQSIESAADLVGLVYNVNEAIRQAPRFPMLIATLEVRGEVLAVIGAAGRSMRRPFDEKARETLTHIGNTATIALRRQRAIGRLEEACSLIERDAQDLAAANQRLRNLDEARAGFLTFISHELATPLTELAAVKMLDRTSAMASGNPLIEAARNGYERLNSFVQKGLAYFDWLSREPVVSNDLTDLVDVAVRVMSRLAPSCQERIALDRGQGPCIARIPENAADAILTILLGNAVKFSEDGDPIGLTFKSAGNEALLSVSDQGRGFAPEWASELFRPFTVADTLHHTRGSGLSLATASVIAQSFSGSMDAKSAGPGRGAAFTLRLPGEGVPSAAPGTPKLAAAKSTASTTERP